MTEPRQSNSAKCKDSDVHLPLSEEEAEALRRALYGWNLSARQYEILDAISDRLGAPEQRSWDEFGVNEDRWAELLKLAKRAAGNG